MSYAAAAALQGAIFARLQAHPGLVGVPVVDAMPPGSGAGLFVLIGPEEVREASDKSGAGAEHRLVISVISDAAGFAQAKTAAVAVAEALDGVPPSLPMGRVVSLGFAKAVAWRLDDSAARRIDLTFRARIEF